ncbi:MAG TPA: phospholipase D-like domain-containing protein [Puia sp.]|nr:phospholipase D-like domain-containing protein [Puia sp.]
MASQNVKNGFSVRLYQGDAKTLLAFNLPKNKTTRLAGFTIQCTPQGKPSFYLFNELQFASAAGHAQNTAEPARSSINTPFQLFRWVHVPGSFHQGNQVFFGKYTYTVTPRYFNNKNLLTTIDLSLSVAADIILAPFLKGNIELGFTRGFVQSQAFVNHFGPQALFRPKAKGLTFDTSQVAGKDSDGNSYKFSDEYAWSGYTAREKIFTLLGDVEKDGSLSLDVLAYDFNEPDIINNFLKLAAQGRIRMILDNATLHHNSANSKPEDQFEAAFKKQAKNPAAIIRGKFARFQHNKVLIVKKGKQAIKVLSGSTNFSITGMYVNSNHVVIFNDASIAAAYSSAFDEAWNDGVNEKAFLNAAISEKKFPFSAKGLPQMSITFSPHVTSFALSTLTNIANRIGAEKSSVLFAIMDTDPTVNGPVIPAIINLHKQQKIFSYGISDSVKTISLYKPNTKNGIQVTGKPGTTQLPPPFDKEVTVGIGHQVHHKFIVCGFNTINAVVWFGSSNLAEGGEEQNGDNLIEIHDQDIATVFAIEALALVDHFLFRDTFTSKGQNSKPKPLILQTNDSWAAKFFNTNDLHAEERLLFA